MKHPKAINILDALAQATRANIYKLLIGKDKGLSATAISQRLKVPPATLSFHLSLLTDAKLLDADRQGRTITYSARKKEIKNLMEYLNEPLE